MGRPVPAGRSPGLPIIKTASWAARDDVPYGIMLMIVATALFACASAASKWLVAGYPVGEVLFLRSFSSFVACAAMMLPVTGLSVFATRRPRDHSRAACRSRFRRRRCCWRSA